jgi:putative Holliday junction resolvase
MNSDDFGGGINLLFSAKLVDKVRFREKNHEFGAIGIDVGEKRVGLAAGNSRFHMAFPLKTLPNDDDVYFKIFAEAYQKTAQVLVIGLPRNADGQETKQSQKVRQFAKTLQEAIDQSATIIPDDSGESGDAEIEIQIIFQDESLTSVVAAEKLRARKDFNEKMLRDGTLDSEAAALILQDFLDSQETKDGVA